VEEVKGVDELGVRVACRGARSRGDRRSDIAVDPKRRSIRLCRLCAGKTVATIGHTLRGRSVQFVGGFYCTTFSVHARRQQSTFGSGSGPPSPMPWCLLFVLIRQGRGGARASTFDEGAGKGDRRTNRTFGSHPLRTLSHGENTDPRTDGEDPFQM